MKIKIQNRTQSNLNLKYLASEIDTYKVKKKSKINEVYFESLAAVRKILTDKRLEVWRTIRDHKPESIIQLSLILDRSFRSVQRDVILLRDLGLIEYIENPDGNGNDQQLVSLFDELALAVA